MATPTQTQPYAGGNPYPPPASQGGPAAPPQAGYGGEARQTQHPPGQYNMPPTYNFDKYCVIHIATTCDEHGVYVTKDSAEVFEIGWVVVDARDPTLPEVRDMRKSDLVTSATCSPHCHPKLLVRRLH